MVTLNHPTHIIVVYNDILDVRVVRDGVVCESIVPTQQLLQTIYASMGTVKETHSDFLSEYLISQTGGLTYFIAPHKRTIKIKEDSFEVFLPALIYRVVGKEVYTYAVNVKARSDLSPNTSLMQVPLPNIYGDGRMCYGSASHFDGIKYSSGQVLSLAEEAVFGVPFSEEVHNIYLYNDLIKWYNESLSAKSITKFWEKKLEKLPEKIRLSAFL